MPKHNNYDYEERLNSQIHKYFSPSMTDDSAEETDGGLSTKVAGASFNNSNR